MAKMRKFLFWNEAGDEKETEQLSLKKAIMSVQSNFKDRMISVEYISKKILLFFQPQNLTESHLFQDKYLAIRFYSLLCLY